MRSTTFALSGATIIVGIAHARSRTPVCSAVYPSTNWKYWVSTKIEPNIAKNTAEIAPLPALKRGFLKNRRSSIGSSVCSSHQKNAAATTAPAANTTTVLVAVQPLRRRLDHRVEQQAQIRRSTATAPTGSSFGAAGSFESGMRKTPGEDAERDDRQVHEEHRAPVEVLEQEPADQRAERDRDSGRRRPHADGLAPLGRGEHVGDDRQRRRHDERAADAHERAGGDELLRAVRQRGEQRSQPEQRQPELQRRKPAEAVAQASRR